MTVVCRFSFSPCSGNVMTTCQHSPIQQLPHPPLRSIFFCLSSHLKTLISRRLCLSFLLQHILNQIWLHQPTLDTCLELPVSLCHLFKQTRGGSVLNLMFSLPDATISCSAPTKHSSTWTQAEATRPSQEHSR